MVWSECVAWPGVKISFLVSVIIRVRSWSCFNPLNLITDSCCAAKLCLMEIPKCPKRMSYRHKWKVATRWYKTFMILWRNLKATRKRKLETTLTDANRDFTNNEALQTLISCIVWNTSFSLSLSLEQLDVMKSFICEIKTLRVFQKKSSSSTFPILLSVSVLRCGNDRLHTVKSNSSLRGW